MEKLKGHVSDNLLEQLPNIKHHYIESEHPDHHWHLLNVKDEIVLDLGCGYHMIEPGWDSTPGYFIKKGAKKVIGVDPACNDIEELKKNYTNHSFHCDMINSHEKIVSYIKDNNVTSLKMDIEGFEICFINDNEVYPSLKYVAIETHSKDLLNSMISKLIRIGFEIDTICTFYPRVYDICNLIYASRKS